VLGDSGDATPIREEEPPPFRKRELLPVTSDIVLSGYAEFSSARVLFLACQIATEARLGDAYHASGRRCCNCKGSAIDSPSHD
jgi:hypothetical protein